MFRTLTPILSIIIAVAVLLVYVKPTYERINRIEGEKNEYSKAVQKASEFNALLEQHINTKNSLSPYNDSLFALVPDEIDVVNALVDLQEIARKNNVLLGNIEVGLDAETQTNTRSSANDNSPASVSGVDESDFSINEFSFDIIGTYEQLRTFMYAIERSLVMMEIVNLSFDVIEGDMQQYTFTVRMFSLRSNTE